jgi:hypothetical protein
MKGILPRPIEKLTLLECPKTSDPMLRKEVLVTMSPLFLMAKYLIFKMVTLVCS